MIAPFVPSEGPSNVVRLVCTAGSVTCRWFLLHVQVYACLCLMNAVPSSGSSFSLAMVSRVSGGVPGIRLGETVALDVFRPGKVPYGACTLGVGAISVVLVRLAVRRRFPNLTT